METVAFISIALVITNIIVTWRGFRDYSFFQRYCFNISQVSYYRDYRRFITSGFLHASWVHLMFNIIALYSFGEVLELSVGVTKFLTIYFVSLVAGNLVSYFIHRHKSAYSSVGASGAISGIVFAAIGMFPDLRMSLFFIPIMLPGWLFALLYVVYCMFGIRAQRDNIGHDAHLGGGIAGLIVTVALFPNIISQNYFPILLILIPSMIFLFLALSRPDFLLVEKPFREPEGGLTMEDKYNSSRRMKERELDRLLDKISTSGIHSLTKKEKQRLEELSKVN